MLSVGTRVGAYEITALLGRGGMGEVYRAHDARLARDVALKVLPESFASDAERLARFEREARVLASLTHAGIGAIYGLEDIVVEGGATARALVLELVEGETLADRIARGPVPLDEALPVARQIAEALEAAHEQGVIHRDLKPANIKLTPGGVVKVLDFGLAKALEPGGAAVSGPHVSESPTITTPAMTRMGLILGTAAYMSPEQARGRAADRRSDLWAFGCVLYEMLTGRRPFVASTGSPSLGGAPREDEDVSDTLAAVLRADPDWTALPSDTPVSVRRLLGRCLEKDRTRRLQHAADAVIRIDDAGHEPAVSTAGARPARRSDRPWMFAAAALGVVAIVFAVPALSHLRERPVDLAETRTDIIVPSTTDPVSFALSPDGRQVVFVASAEDVPRLWIRRLISPEAQPLPGTEGASSPFWKPDGRSIGFFAEGRLKVLDLAAGQPRAIAGAGGGRGATWNTDDVIVFNPSSIGGLFRVPAAGGDVMPVTTLGGAQTHRYPWFLPDGRHFLFFSMGGGPAAQGVYLGAIDSPETTLLAASASAAIHVSGWVLMARDGALVAQRLDLDRRALTGDVAAVANPVISDALGGIAVSASTTGTIAYRSGLQIRRQLRWVARSGTVLGTLGDLDDAGMSFPRLSHDERLVSVHRVVDGNSDVWVLDGSRRTRFTTDLAQDRFAVSSRRSGRIVFESNRGGTRALYIRPADRSSPEQPLGEFKPGENAVAQEWTPDDGVVVYVLIRDTDYDLGTLQIDDGTRHPLLATGFTEKGPALSRDGRLIAYMSDESGSMEVYAGRFVPPRGTEAGRIEGQRLVSTAGGIYPAWSPSGNEIYYLAPDGTMMAVPISVTNAFVEAGTPEPLFQSGIVGGGTDVQQARQYDVARDGRLLVNTLLDDATPITLLQNWRPQ